MKVNGKGFMVWKLRDWMGGDPARQVAQALALGLSWVSVKIINGTAERWEGSTPNQNADLLPATAKALRNMGISVIGWGWVICKRFGIPSTAVARTEARKTVEILRRHGMTHYQVDGEHHFRSAGMAPVAREYSTWINLVGPDIEYSLCSYRFPVTHQPKFPVHEFSPYMDAWSPQVYFLEDNRQAGGAIQLEQSFRMYRDQIKALPYFPIGPTYLHKRKAIQWRASGMQIQLFMEKAKDLGCPAVGFWDLPQASSEQLKAVENFDWNQKPPDHVHDLRNLAGALRMSASELEKIANEL